MHTDFVHAAAGILYLDITSDPEMSVGWVHDPGDGYGRSVTVAEAIALAPAARDLILTTTRAMVAEGIVTCREQHGTTRELLAWRTLENELVAAECGSDHVRREYAPRCSLRSPGTHHIWIMTYRARIAADRDHQRYKRCLERLIGARARTSDDLPF